MGLRLITEIFLLIKPEFSEKFSLHLSLEKYRKGDTGILFHRFKEAHQKIWPAIKLLHGKLRFYSYLELLNMTVMHLGKIYIWLISLLFLTFDSLLENY